MLDKSNQSDIYSNTDNYSYISFSGYVFPHGSLTYEHEDTICKVFTCAEFSQLCNMLSYFQLCQVADELALRAGKMKVQIEHRHADAQWRNKVDMALSIIHQKISIISNHINYIRNNNIDLILDKIGHVGSLPDRRLAAIKCLLAIFDGMNIQGLGHTERSVVDACRSMSGRSTESVFDAYSYDATRRMIVSSTGMDVAAMSANGPDSEEIGYRMAASDDMADLLSRVEPILKAMAIRMHDNAIGELHRETVDLLGRIK